MLEMYLGMGFSYSIGMLLWVLWRSKHDPYTRTYMMDMNTGRIVWSHFKMIIIWPYYLLMSFEIFHKWRTRHQTDDVLNEARKLKDQDKEK